MANDTMPDGLAPVNEQRIDISLRVNGAHYSVSVPPRLLLADLLRHRLGLTGTHIGCEQGVCGACTVIIDGHAARSCLILAVQGNGCSITTVEGLAGHEESLTDLQASFHRCHALQCGYCIPGFLMMLTEFLETNADPTTEEIREALSANLCRCTGYVNMIEAVRQVVALRRSAA